MHSVVKEAGDKANEHIRAIIADPAAKPDAGAEAGAKTIARAGRITGQAMGDVDCH